MKRLILLWISLITLPISCTTTTTQQNSAASGSRETTVPATESEGSNASDNATAASFRPPFKPPAGSIQLSNATCPADATHIYHPFRLYLLAGCKQYAVLGHIVNEKPEPDGDFHVRFAVDQGQKDPNGGNWTNAGNKNAQHGYLVLEPTCENQVTQADAVAACQGYHNTLVLPAIGKRVSAIGYWLFDADHGWNELHEVTAFGTPSLS